MTKYNNMATTQNFVARRTGAAQSESDYGLDDWGLIPGRGK
jgi:hypothetical protein